MKLSFLKSLANLSDYSEPPLLSVLLHQPDQQEDTMSSTLSHKIQDISTIDTIELDRNNLI